jgi:hypothetical protein
VRAVATPAATRVSGTGALLLCSISSEKSLPRGVSLPVVRLAGGDVLTSASRAKRLIYTMRWIEQPPVEGRTEEK